MIFSKLSHLACGNAKEYDFICEDWKNKGYCTHSFVDYMEKYCRKSCGFCGK